MKILKFSNLRSVSLLMIGLIASGCVNEEYDLSKEIDSEAVMLKDLSIRAGSMEKITIGDMLSLEDGEYSVISVNEDGDYILSFKGEETTMEFSLADTDNSIHTEATTVRFNTGRFAGLAGSSVNTNIHYSDVTGKPFETTLAIDLETPLAEQVTSIRKVSMSAPLSVNFAVNSGAVHLQEGFVIDFPDYLHVTASGSTAYTVVEGNMVKIIHDIDVTPSSPLQIRLDIDEVNVPDNAYSDGVLYINDEVTVRGDFYLDPSDFQIVPAVTVIDITADVSDFEVLAAEVMFDYTGTVEGTYLEFSDLPEFMTGDNVCVDLYNPTLTLQVDNGTPVSFDVSASVRAYKGDDIPDEITIGVDPKISIPASSSAEYLISRRETQTDADVVNIVVPELGEMIGMMPDRLWVDDITITSVSKDYVRVTTGDYHAALNYSFKSPLAFGTGLNLGISHEVQVGLDEEASIAIPVLNVVFSLENTIPVDFGITAVALDADGNEISDISITVDKPIKAGSLSKPSAEEVTLSLECASGSLNFDALRLSLKAEVSDPEFAGMPLNKNQGLEVRDCVFNLPEGVITEMF